MKFKFYYSLVLLLQLFNLNLFSQVNTEWVRTYNGSANNNDFGVKSVVDDSGNVYVAGGSAELITGCDIVLVKYNSAGIQQWKQLYKSTGNYSEQVNHMVLDKNGFIYIAGSTYLSTPFVDILILKYNSSGNLIWDIVYNASPENADGANSIVLDNFNNVIVTGTSYTELTKNDMVTLKYNEYGELQWVQKFNSPINGDDISFSSVIDTLGNIYITGRSEYESQYFDAVTIKYSSIGVQQWIKRVNGLQNFYDFSNIIKLDRNNNVYIAGYIVNQPLNLDFLTVKYNMDGVTLWSAAYNSPGNKTDVARAMVINDEGSVYVTGDCLPDVTKTVTVKYNSSGMLQWEGILNDFGSNPVSIAIDSQENIYVTGDGVPVGPYFDIYTVKYNYDGDKKWVQLYNGLSNRDDRSSSIAIDNFTNIYITGTSYCNGYDDMLTLKYSQLTGVSPISNNVPEKYCLYQNFPNPFNPYTVIKYDIPENRFVNVKIYNSIGKEILSLVNKFQAAGKYQVNFDGSNYPSGIYFLKLSANDFSDVKKMILLK